LPIYHLEGGILAYLDYIAATKVKKKQQCEGDDTGNIDICRRMLCIFWQTCGSKWRTKANSKVCFLSCLQRSDGPSIARRIINTHVWYYQ
jgi:hypothetical protein